MRSPRRAGFTIVELTIVLALIGVTMGMILVRFDFGSPRQKVIAEAKRLGHAISTYRERALTDFNVYALRFDLPNNRWDVFQVEERGVLNLGNVAPICTGTVEAPVHLRALLSATGVQLDPNATVYFDSRGVTSDFSVELGVERGFGLRLRIDPLVNDVSYIAE